MVEHCFSPYLLLALVIIVALFVGLGLWEQLRLRSRADSFFDRQGSRLLLTMLGVALISIVIFVIFLTHPQSGC